MWRIRVNVPFRASLSRRTFSIPTAFLKALSLGAKRVDLSNAPERYSSRPANLMASSSLGRRMDW
ncbi:unnamed protein product, partial [Ixodes hexagonus]